MRHKASAGQSKKHAVGTLELTLLNLIAVRFLRLRMRLPFLS